MKKLILLATFISLAFFSCKDKEGDLNPNDSGTQNLASSTPENRTVVLEEYTGVRCTYCPDGHRRAQSFADAHPGKVILINVHTGNYATPSPGWPDFTTNYGAALATKSGMGQPGTGYPGGSVSRNTFASEPTVTSYKMAAGAQYTLLNRGGWWNSTNSTSPAGDIILAKPAPVNVGIKVKSYNEATREVKLMVELYFTETVSDGALLNVALLESEVKGKQIDAGVTNANYMHKHMLRDLLTGQWGESISAAECVKGNRVKKEYTYVIAAKDKNSVDINVANCDFAAYVSSNTNNDIYNGKEISVK